MARFGGLMGVSVAAGNFDKAFALVLAHEGGYVNHPKDPGGATNMGVTQRVYDAFRRTNKKPVQSVRYITKAEAKAIYKQQYWQPVKGELLPIGVDYAVFDFAVNSGVARASRYLQISLGMRKADQDGIIGLMTVGNAMGANDHNLITRLCVNRMAFVKSLSTWSTFGKGWTRRIMGASDGFQASDTGVIDYAINMTLAKPQALPMPTVIGGKVGAEPEPQTAKAVNDDFDFNPVSDGPISYDQAKAVGWGR